MVAQLLPQPHPIVGAVVAARESVQSVRDLQPVYLSPGEKQVAVTELARLEAVAAELKLRIVATADDAASVALARDTGVWLASVTHSDFPVGRADARLAGALNRRWAAVADGMADGVVSREQARAVVEALDDLPADLDPALVTQAEAELIGYCAEFRPSELRRLGRHILEVVAPDIAEAEEARRLQNEEQRAREKCRLTLRATGEGSTRLSGLLPDAGATRLRTYLEAFTSPRKTDPTAFVAGEEDRIPYPRKLGQAFCALLEHLDPTRLPAHGGDATTVLVTIGLGSLRSQLGFGSVIGGGDLSATAVRRLACSAGIVPVVLGGKGEVLDLGRTRRLFSAAQRKALRLRDQRCRAEGCTIPATWCEAHHLKPWSVGGRTDLADGVLYCSWHHHRAHDPRYEASRLPNGDSRFHRRT